MKRILITTLFVFLYAYVAEAQQTVLAKFIIKDARRNGQDITPGMAAQNAYVILYTLPNDTTIYLANVMAVANSQSFGPTYHMRSFNTPKTNTNYETDHFEFDWSYQNSYDTHKGTARMELLKIGKPNGVAFQLTMITEALDVTVFKGYMDGTLNLPPSN